jgi:small-conductance mechanosensitive channel
MGLLETTLYGNALLRWLLALGLAAAIALGVALARSLLLRRFAARAARSSTQIDDAALDMLRATRLWLVVALALAIAGQGLELPARGARVLGGVATAALFLQIGFWASALLTFWLTRSQRRAASAAGSAAATSLSALGLLGQLLLWALVLLVLLDNLGVNVTTLIAGLGIGGIAIALAVQNILGDLFASLSIVIDKPFVVGDFIIVDSFMGTVEHVGLKTTRLRSLDGEQIVFSNSDLLQTRLRNYKRMRERRIVFPFRVSHETAPEQLEQIPGVVQGLVEGFSSARFERSHFTRFGDASYEFETVFWMTTPDYNAYMDVQQALNLRLIREFLQRGISFALPTQVAPASRARPVESRPREGGALQITRR